MVITDKIERNIASHTAKVLMEHGMLYGQELEDYLKLSVLGYLNFKSDEHYLAFENLVLEYIDARRDYYIIFDTKTNKKIEVPTINAVLTKLGGTKPRLLRLMDQGELIKDRYKVLHISMKAHEI